MSAVRRASVAGTWYPGDAARLADEVDRHIASADVEACGGDVRAIVVPHAGLQYSGPVAAFAYKAVVLAGYEALVLVGPSHFVPFSGVSLWPAGAWETPFGPVEVDRELAGAIASACGSVIEYPAAHRREHSLEMQLPFIARLAPAAPIVPLVMGYQTREVAMALGDALARAVSAYETRGAARDATRGPRGGPEHTGRRRVLLVASTDLSHFENARTAATLDAVVASRVEALDDEGLMRALEDDPRHACGGGPTVAVLRAARLLGATEARVLRYADSGDVSGDKSSVVGYMAAAVW